MSGSTAPGCQRNENSRSGSIRSIVLPNDPALRARLDFVKDVVTDQVGHFELKGVAPGVYKLFAWDDIEPGNWLDPDVLRVVEAKGEAVTVKAKESATAALRVIP